jgi:hypothetical protein
VKTGKTPSCFRTAYVGEAVKGVLLFRKLRGKTPFPEGFLGKAQGTALLPSEILV